jgi:hypothetical protein
VPEYTDWVQLDGFRTREEHRITPQFTDAISHFHDADGSGEHGGTIGHFETQVYRPAFDLEMFTNESQVNDRRISYVYLREWLTTPSVAADPHYDAAAQFWGSIGGVHDWNPLVWELETRQAALAEFDADPPPGVTFRFLEWETNPFQPGPFGVYTARTIEVNLEDATTESFTRAGDPDGGDTSPPLTHALVALGRDGEETASVFDYGWDTDQEWYVVSNGFSGSLQDAATAGQILEDGFDAQLRLDLDDSWWAANATPANGLAEGVASTSKETLALPLVFGLADPINDTATLNTSGEFEMSWRHEGSLFFEHDWTPPRYRIVYTSDPVTASLRHFPRRGDGTGWGSVTRGYPSNPSRRGYGGARQP